MSCNSSSGCLESRFHTVSTRRMPQAELASPQNSKICHMGTMIQQDHQSVLPGTGLASTQLRQESFKRLHIIGHCLGKRLCIGCIQGSLVSDMNIAWHFCKTSRCLSGIRCAKVLRHNSSHCSSARQRIPLMIRTFPFQRFVRRKLT